MPNLPWEILNPIIRFLDPFQAKKAANALSFIDEDESHRLWRTIFKDDAWIKMALNCGSDPVLIGANLRTVTNSCQAKKGGKPLYIVLRANDWSGDTRYAGVTSLRRSLRTDHRYDEKNHEVTLPKLSWYNTANKKITVPKIKLNVKDIVFGTEIMELKGKTTRKLFEQNPLRSNFCFYSSGNICTLASPNIVGVGGSISQRGALTPICVLNLPSSRHQGKTWQFTIETPGCPPVKPILKNGKTGPIVGYRY